MKKTIHYDGSFSVFHWSIYAQEGKAKDSTKTANIQEVVITSLGIKRQARSLTYSAQQMGGMILLKLKPQFIKLHQRKSIQRSD